MTQQSDLKALLSCLTPGEKRKERFVKKNLEVIVGHPCYRTDWSNEQRRKWITFHMEDPDKAKPRERQIFDGYEPESEKPNPEDELLRKEAAKNPEKRAEDNLLEAWYRQAKKTLPKTIEEVVDQYKPRKNVEAALKILVVLLFESGSMKEAELAVKRNGSLNIHYLCAEINEYALAQRSLRRKHKLSRRKKKLLVSDKTLDKWIDVISESLRKNLTPDDDR